MYLINKTDSQVVLSEVVGGKDLVIPPKGKSVEVVPNKKILSKIIVNPSRFEIHVTRASEITAISEMDERFETLIILD